MSAPGRPSSANALRLGGKARSAKGAPASAAGRPAVGYRHALHDGTAGNGFGRIDGDLWVEELPLATVAERHGTPCFVYSRAMLEHAWREYDAAFAGVAHLVCYAIKANSNLAVLNLFARQGSGFDIVSGGELARVLAAGGDPAKVVFSGVGKTAAEMEAALAAGILCFNVESAAELETLNRVAGRTGRTAPVSFRVNPDVDPKTHPYISTGLKESKFGVAFAEARALYARAAAMPHVAVRGIDIHIGSQIGDLAPHREAAVKVRELVEALAADGIALHHIDLGGGLGIRYDDEVPLPLADYAAMLRDVFRGRHETLLLEPGRRLVGEAGVLLTRVLYLKPGAERSFAIVDAAMNDLIRPALYAAWHAVEPVIPRAGPTRRYQIVGPICESADFIASDRDLALAEGDLLAVRAAGAYAFAMSSNYNTRPRACEVIVDGTRTYLARERETLAELFAHESTLP
jgi:diaminopimelate decarboxylase